MCIFLMDDVDEILQVLFIGIAVASVLLQTGRSIKAIELFSECLVLLKKYSLKLEICKLNELFALVYDRLVNLYCFVSEQRENFESLLLEANTHGKEIIAEFLHRLGRVSLSRFEHVQFFEFSAPSKKSSKFYKFSSSVHVLRNPEQISFSAT